MTFIEAVLLGALQGLTEFLPVSSSGHLVLAETFLQLQIHPTDLQGFDVLLHVATALALLLVYAKTWKKILLSPMNKDAQHQKLLLYLVLATIPGAVAGLLLKDSIAEHFRSVTSVATALFVTGIVLLIAHRSRGKKGMQSMNLATVFAMGCAQACALVPGLSRSGLSISAGQVMGLKRQEALDFSFLMALPIIFGAFAVTAGDLLHGSIVMPELSTALIGFVASFFSSLLAIVFLRKFIARHSLAWFTLYLLPISIYILLWQ